MSVVYIIFFYNKIPVNIEAMSRNSNFIIMNKLNPIFNKAQILFD